MVEIPDSLRSVFSATVHERDGTYVLEVPSGELSYDAVSLGETYRIAVFDAPTSEQDEHESVSADRAHLTVSVNLLSRLLRRVKYAR